MAHIEADQPYPKTTIYVPVPAKRGSATAITRIWPTGSVGTKGCCRLCPECHAVDDVCLVVVDKEVQPRDAPLFSVSDFMAKTGAIPFVDDTLRYIFPCPEASVGTTAFVPNEKLEAEDVAVIYDQLPDDLRKIVTGISESRVIRKGEGCDPSHVPRKFYKIDLGHVIASPLPRKD